MSIFWTELPGANETTVGAHRKLHDQGHVKTIGADHVYPHAVTVEWVSSSGRAAGRKPRCLLAGSQWLISVPW